MNLHMFFSSAIPLLQRALKQQSCCVFAAAIHLVATVPDVSVQAQVAGEGERQWEGDAPGVLGGGVLAAQLGHGGVQRVGGAQQGPCRP